MKGKKQTALLLVALNALVLFSCNEDGFDNEADDPVLRKTGTAAKIVYTGAEVYDGCGYMIQTQDKSYKALNLPTSFEVDKLEVIIKYEVTPDGFQCGISPDLKTTINLLGIIKK